MNNEIQAFNDKQSLSEHEICNLLAATIDKYLPEAESKIWHGHPVWFLEGNPIVGYSKLKECVRLFFWSGADFEEENLKINTGKFKDASIRYTSLEQINLDDLVRWIIKSSEVQWDYKSLIKKKGRLERLK